MNRRRRIVVAQLLIWFTVTTVSAGFAASAGCQSGLCVRVEKIEGIQSRLPDVSAAALSVIHDALSGLDDICTECRLAWGDETVEGAIAELADAQRESRILLPVVRDVMMRQARGELSGASLAAQVSALHQRARSIMPRIDIDALRGLIPLEMSDAERAAMRRLASDLVPMIDAHAARLAAVRPMPGFGGYRQGGVYQINPGDPAYGRVLNAGVAAQPITEIVLNAAGDTCVMLVQESPAQLRLYQVSNDPTSILRNASFILNKIMQGAVKFSAIE